MKRKGFLSLMIVALAALSLAILAACEGTHTHEYVFVMYIESPTCTRRGEKLMECSICGKEIVESVDRLEHDWEEVTVPSTCISQGSITRTCKLCGETEEVPLPLAEHQMQYDGENKEPTCIEDGYTESGVCTVCGQTFPRTTVPALGHDYENGICKRCGAEFSYTVKFHDEYNNIPAQSYKPGEHFAPPTLPNIPQDHIFEGWYLEDGTTRFDETVEITEDLELYGKWLATHAVSNAAELAAIKDDPAAHYYLTKDIRMNGAVWTPVETFSGILDGRGYKIVDMNLTDGDAGYQFAMFITNDGEIRDLEIHDVNYNVVNHRAAGTAASYFSVLAAHNNGVIDGCSVTSGVYKYTYDPVDCNEPFYFGLFAAENAGMVKDCFATVDVTCDIRGTADVSDVNFGSNMYNGGIVGGNAGTVTSCHYNGTFTTANNPRGLHSRGYYGGHYYSYQYNHCWFGGVAGMQNGGTLTNSYAEFTYENTQTTVDYAHACANIGGLVGSNVGGTVKSCFAIGSILDKACNGTIAGGIVAVNTEKSVVESCHADVDIAAEPTVIYDEATALGGLVGENNATVQNCYCCGDVRAQATGTVGGFAGKNNAQGSISKCYSTGNAAIVNGSGDFFAGKSDGTLFKCYYLESATVQVKDAYLQTAQNGEPKSYSTLWTTEFLVDTLYWDESGWVILVNGNPMLDWEIAVGHTYTTNTVDATCEDIGYTVYTCNDCGCIFVRDYVAPAGHDKILVSHTAATCEEPGKTKYHCNKCNADYEVTEAAEPALQHKPTIAAGDEKADPTCRKLPSGEYEVHDGHTAKVTCERCNQVLQEPQTIQAHQFAVDNANSVKPDCTTEGKNHLVCSICGFVKDEVVPATGHTLKVGSLQCTVCQQPVYDDNFFTKVGSVGELKNIAQNLNGNYMLTANIDLHSEEWTSIGTKTNPFNGVFYGNGFKIMNLLQAETTAGGLFGYNNGSILNLTVENADFTVTDKDNALLGVIAAENSGTIENCTVSGRVQFNVIVRRTSDTFDDNLTLHAVTAGGIAAHNAANGIVRQCTVSAALTVGELTQFTNTAAVDVYFYLDRGWKQGVSRFVAQLTVGGVVGNNSGTVDGCTASGGVEIIVSQQIFVERVVNEGKWNEVKYKAGKMELTAAIYGGSLVGFNGGVVTGGRGGGFAVKTTRCTQDDSSSFFSMTHIIDVRANTEFPQLVGWSQDGKCDDVQTLPL